MDQKKIQTTNTLLQQTESDIKKICSPYNYNCFEISRALSKLFSNHHIQFCSIYAEVEFIDDPKCLPLHITTSIDGELFDAGGHLNQTHLLEEYSPTANEDLIHIDSTYKFEHVTSDSLVDQIHRIYSNNLQR